MKRLILTAAIVACAGPALADGASLFQQRCASCHTITGRSGLAGPSLKGVVGRRPGGLADYNYSAGLKAKGGTWTASTLGAFLTAPAAFAPGSKMFVAVPAAADRAALIAYMTGLK